MEDEDAKILLSKGVIKIGFAARGEYPGLEFDSGLGGSI
jgi:hypothetical protein